MLLRQECDEVPEGTLSCPDRNMEVLNQLRHYEGLRLLPSVCGWKLIQQTLIIIKLITTKMMIIINKSSILIYNCTIRLRDINESL